MATRRPPGLRAGWDHTQPADNALLTRPAEPWPPSRPKAAAHGHAAPAPVPARPPVAAPAPASRPASGFQPTRPFGDAAPTRPATDFSPTRPLSDFQHTRPLSDFQPTRPLTDFQPTRPFGDGAAARPARAGAAAAPAAPAPVPMVRRVPAPVHITPPNAEGHWQVAGGPGQNVVLMPGQMHIGQQVASVRTLLGSCVAITLWHPQRRIGGMCHFLLPSRTHRNGEPPDGRYGDEAVEAMVKALTALRARPEEFVAHLYGGADTMSGVSAAKFNIGERNIEQGWSLIDKYGFQLDGVDVGEDIPRMVSLSLANGSVTMRRGSGQAPDHLRG